MSLLVGMLTNNHWYPLSTLIVNIIGAVLIGFLSGIFALKGQDSGHLQLFLIIGLLGGFTTFSAFSYETVTMLRNGQIFFMVAHIGMHVMFCCSGAAFGLYLSKFLSIW